MTKRTIQEIILLSLSAFAVLSVTPFVFLRYFNDDVAIAIVDLIISVAMLSFFIFVYTTRKVNVANFVLAILAAISVTASTYVKGVSQVYWVYPSIISAYYLMPPKPAVLLSSVTIFILAFILYSQLGVIDFITIFSTVLLSTSFAFIFAFSASKKHKQLSLLATIDPLTSAGNRRALDIQLTKIIGAQTRKKSTVSLILFDLDYFKKINDECGHATGDQVLVSVAKLINEHTRLSDSLYRYGGEEFIIVPLAQSLESANILAEKLRYTIENSNLLPERIVTISLGVAQYRHNETVESWIHRADSALYLAKKSGRNQVRSAA